MTTTASSQAISKDSVVVITPTQLKSANLVFAEHQLLVNKVPLLESKIKNLESIQKRLEMIDSLRSTQVTMYKEAYVQKEKDYLNLKKSLTRTKLFAGGSFLSAIILGLVCLKK